MGQRLNALGVNRLELLNQTHDLIELMFKRRLLIGRDVQSSQLGDKRDVGLSQCHKSG